MVKTKMTEIRVIFPEKMDREINSMIRAGIAGTKAEIVRNAVSHYLSSFPTVYSKNYDLDSIFTPDGRILQVEYADHASNKGLISLGIQCEDGIILIKQKKLSQSPLIQVIEKSDRFRPIKKLTEKIEITTAGISADGDLVIKKPVIM